MGKRKKETKSIRTVNYLVHVWSKEELIRLVEYLTKEYNFDIVLPKENIFPRWFTFYLSDKDAVIDKKFSSVIRRE